MCVCVCVCVCVCIWQLQTCFILILKESFLKKQVKHKNGFIYYNEYTSSLLTLPSWPEHQNTPTVSAEG